MCDRDPLDYGGQRSIVMPQQKGPLTQVHVQWTLSGVELPITRRHLDNLLSDFQHISEGL